MNTLDDLFREAKAHILVEKKAKDAKALKVQGDTSALYNNPDNWERKRGIALVHEETETLLGNFSEYVHRSVRNCRRLVREANPIAIQATERVSGSWWVGGEKVPEVRQIWHERREVVLHLHLDELLVHAPACELEVHLSYGSIARVELLRATTFAQVLDAQEQLLILPAGTNVLPVMGADCKLNLRKGLGI